MKIKKVLTLALTAVVATSILGTHGYADNSAYEQSIDILEVNDINDLFKPKISLFANGCVDGFRHMSNYTIKTIKSKDRDGRLYLVKTKTCNGCGEVEYLEAIEVENFSIILN